MKEPQHSDGGLALTTAMAAGDERALSRAYDQFGRLAYSVALRIVSDQADAEEIVQDVFLSLWRAAGRFDPVRGNLAGYLVSVTRNRSIDRLRRRSSAPDTSGRMPAEQVALHTKTPFDAAALGDDRDRVRRALDQLPEIERQVLELAYFGGLSQTAIAERIAAPLGTIKSRARSGLQRLRAALPGLGVDAP